MCLIRGCCQITTAWFLQWRHGTQGKQWHPCVLTRVGTGVNGGVIAGWTIKGQWGHTLGQQPAAGGGWSMCLFAYTSKPSLSIHWGVCLAWSLPTPSTYSIYLMVFFRHFQRFLFHGLIFSTRVYSFIAFFSMLVVHMSSCYFHSGLCRSEGLCSSAEAALLVATLAAVSS